MPTTSPMETSMKRNEELVGFDPLPHIQYTELKFMSDTESEVPDEEDRQNALIPRLSRMMLLEKPESITESLEGNGGNEVEGEAILHRLKRQVHLDRKSLVALYNELDEERSASAVAANLAMAMIMRLQAEKAAVQMEALQYQRMMEQAKYDQEALQFLKDLLIKREGEIKVLEAELATYREMVRCEEALGIEGCKAWADVQYTRLTSGPSSSSSEKSDCFGLPANLNEEAKTYENIEHFSIENEWGNEELLLEGDDERLSLLHRLRMLGKIHSSSKSRASSLLLSSDIINSKADYKGDGSEILITREISHLGNRLEALEKDKEFLKHAFQSLQKGDKGTQLLMEIAQHIRKLRHIEKMALEGDVV